MPRHIDRARRESEITNAAIRILAEQGPAALTLRRLGDELGGSQTLVTHFFPDREHLFRAITDRLIASYDEEVRALERDAPPLERLRLLLEWMLPLNAESQLAEQGRVFMVSQRATNEDIRHFYEAMDRKMRDLLREHLTPLVPSGQLDVTVDTLRVFVNGVVLSSVEHPGTWPAGRQRKLLSRLLNCLGLSDSATADSGLDPTSERPVALTPPAALR
jgi:AcrR family transcriptional regulator